LDGHETSVAIERSSGSVTLMRYLCKFSVGLAHDGHRPGDVTVDRSDLLESVKARVNGLTPQSPFIFNVCADWTDSGLHAVFEFLLSATGRRPSADLHYAAAHPGGFFPLNVERVPSEDELNQSRWLYLTVPKFSLAKFKSVEPDGSYVITKVCSKKKIAFGCTTTVGWMMLFSEQLKSLFLESSLNAIEFKPVTLENGSPSGLWQMTSPVTFPSLSMKLLDGRRQPFTGDWSKGCGVEDGSYFPMVLRYQQSDVENLTNFDVALSTERLGWASHNIHRMHIVSQRFRRVAEKLAPGQFSYGLVAVGEGDELRTRYTIPELAPPSDAA
jgi:hypothetical protein